jgi:general nucleoside transport system ATP-binding protein
MEEDNPLMEPSTGSQPASQITVPETASSQAPLLSLRGITKRFPMVLANDHIDLDVYQGEIHALLGENGAGKSTLMKILYGFYRADSGSVVMNDQAVEIHSPADARKLEIGMLFQDFSLIPAMNVAENIALFLEELKMVIDYNQIDQHIQELATRYNLQVRSRIRVADLSIGEQQKVEILKLLISGARILILDEPTRVLAPHEITALYQVLDNLRANGYAIILITHKMKEVLECADRITILRSGCVAGSLCRHEANQQKLVSLMFGKEMPDLSKNQKALAKEPSVPILELQGVETRGEGAETSLKEINLKIFPGEIVGVAGVSGNGQKELGDLVLGMVSCARGTKLLFGKDATRLSIREIRRQGVAFIPENPLVMASVPWMTVLENIALTRPWRYVLRRGLSIDWDSVWRDAQAGLEKMAYKLPLYAPARSLSGGNLQRMVIIRELGLNPGLIVASYMTRGLDVQSTIAARQALLDARQGGAGVLLISEDLEELFTLSDRLIVLYGGQIVGEFLPEETDIYQVGYLMTGSRDDRDATR